MNPPRLALFVPCFVDAFRPEAAHATVRVLRRLGLEVEFPPGQTCCGQMHFNAGHVDAARELAWRFLRIFEPYDAVVAPSGSCVAMVRRHYPSLVGDHPLCARTLELSEFLAARDDLDRLGARLPAAAVLHVGCHARRGLGAAPAARRVLEAVAGLRLVPTASDEECCGFGGTFAVKLPEVSAEIGRRKLAPILRADPDLVVSTDPSCLLHLGGLLARAGRDRPRLLHLAEALDAREEAR